MKFGKSIGMIPLVVTISTNTYTFQRTKLSFNESDVRQNLIGLDQNTFNRLVNTDKYMFNEIYLEDRFRKYFLNWQKETKYLSRVDKIIENPNFQSIVSMGDKVLPLILEEINQNPSNLVWALNIILNTRISENDITITEACKKWVKWGFSNKFIVKKELASVY